MKKFTIKQEAYLADIEQMLLERMADFLDEPEIEQKQWSAEIKDPDPRDKTELHIRMAKSAMIEYKKTMISSS